jgi:hypothetical protein
MKKLTEKIKKNPVRSQLRFSDRKELELVQTAAVVSGAKSMNHWIVKTLLDAARAALAIKPRSCS